MLTRGLQSSEPRPWLPIIVRVAAGARRCGGTAICDLHAYDCTLAVGESGSAAMRYGGASDVHRGG
jgi:hypothetical protein